jgi:hypothetical protein
MSKVSYRDYIFSEQGMLNILSCAHDSSSRPSSTKLTLQASPPVSSQQFPVQVALQGSAEMNDMTPTHVSSSSEDLTARGYGSMGVWGIATLPKVYFPGDFKKSKTAA